MALLSAEEIGPLHRSRRLALGMGGAESNVAIGLARLGVPAVWVGRVGDDPFGDLIARELRAEAVDARVIVDPAAPTGLMIKERPTAHHQSVTYRRAGSAGSRVTIDDIGVGTVRDAGMLHVTGITAALSDSARRAVDETVRIARDAGVPVSVDLNFRRALWPEELAAQWYRSVLAYADLVFAGLPEATIAVGSALPPEECAHRLQEMGARTSVVTLGPQGALAWQDGVLHRSPARAVAAVDTVGAGDAFVAGYLSRAWAGAGIAECLATGNDAGAFACTVPGDWEGSPRLAQLKLLRADDPVSR